MGYFGNILDKYIILPLPLMVGDNDACRKGPSDLSMLQKHIFPLSLSTVASRASVVSAVKGHSV